MTGNEKPGYDPKKRDGKTAFTLPHVVLDSPAYLTASPRARVLLNDIGRFYNGFNNGDLAFTWATAQARGWVSKGTLFKAKCELLAHGLIFETRKGSRDHKASLYALTWCALDECKGKLDIVPAAFPRGAYRHYQPNKKEKKLTNFEINRRNLTTPPTGLVCPSHRANSRTKRGSTAPPTGPIEPKNEAKLPLPQGPFIVLPSTTTLSGSAPRVPSPWIGSIPECMMLRDPDSPAAHRAAESWGLIETSPSLYERSHKPITAPGASIEPDTGPSHLMAAELTYESIDEQAPPDYEDSVLEDSCDG